MRGGKKKKKSAHRALQFSLPPCGALTCAHQEDRGESHAPERPHVSLWARWRAGWIESSPPSPLSREPRNFARNLSPLSGSPLRAEQLYSVRHHLPAQTMNARFSVSAHTNSYRLSSDPQRETHVLILFSFFFSFLFFGGDLKQVLKQSHPTAPRMCHVKTESSLKRAQGSSSLAFSLCAFKGLKNKTLVKQPPGCRKAASTSSN